MEEKKGICGNCKHESICKYKETCEKLEADVAKIFNMGYDKMFSLAMRCKSFQSCNPEYSSNYRKVEDIDYRVKNICYNETIN